MKKIVFFLMLLLCDVAAAADTEVWQRIYAQVPEAYVYETTPENLAVAALKALHDVDKNLTIGDDKNRITLYYKGLVAAVLRKPEDKSDVRAWAELTSAMIDAATQKSPEAARRDFELADVMARGMAGILDKDSKFYGDADEVYDILPRNRRTFVARKDGHNLYIKIAAFNKQTVKELRQALQDYAEMPELILDLRGCPGGMLGEAIKAADLFLDGGIVVSTKGKLPEEVFYTAYEGDMWHGKPITVLVDRDTASAAEVLAAALQEQGRAEIAGDKTKGKGSVQKLVLLSGGSVLAVTSSFFMTPSGRELNGKGVVPDKKLPESYEN